MLTRLFWSHTAFFVSLIQHSFKIKDTFSNKGEIFEAAILSYTEKQYAVSKINIYLLDSLPLNVFFFSIQEARLTSEEIINVQQMSATREMHKEQLIIVTIIYWAWKLTGTVKTYFKTFII